MTSPEYPSSAKTTLDPLPRMKKGMDSSRANWTSSTSSSSVRGSAKKRAGPPMRIVQYLDRSTSRRTDTFKSAGKFIGDLSDIPRSQKSDHGGLRVFAMTQII